MYTPLQGSTVRDTYIYIIMVSGQRTLSGTSKQYIYIYRCESLSVREIGQTLSTFFQFDHYRVSTGTTTRGALKFRWRYHIFYLFRAKIRMRSRTGFGGSTIFSEQYHIISDGP